MRETFFIDKNSFSRKLLRKMGKKELSFVSLTVLSYDMLNCIVKRFRGHLIRLLRLGFLGKTLAQGFIVNSLQRLFHRPTSTLSKQKRDNICLLIRLETATHFVVTCQLQIS